MTAAVPSVPSVVPNPAWATLPIFDRTGWKRMAFGAFAERAIRDTPVFDRRWAVGPIRGCPRLGPSLFEPVQARRERLSAAVQEGMSRDEQRRRDGSRPGLGWWILWVVEGGPIDGQPSIK